MLLIMQRSQARTGIGHAKLRGWDVVLKSEGLNPGTSADLTVAALFWDLLMQEGVGAGNSIGPGMQ